MRMMNRAWFPMPFLLLLLLGAILMRPGGCSASDSPPDGEKPAHVDSEVEVHSRIVKALTLFGWRSRQLALVDGPFSQLKLCKRRWGKLTSSCKKLTLDGTSKVVEVNETWVKGRSMFRVVTEPPHDHVMMPPADGSPPLREMENMMMMLDAGSQEELQEWMEVVETAMDRARANDQRVHRRRARNDLTDPPSPMELSLVGNTLSLCYPENPTAPSQEMTLDASSEIIELAQAKHDPHFVFRVTTGRRRYGRWPQMMVIDSYTLDTHNEWVSLVTDIINKARADVLSEEGLEDGDNPRAKNVGDFVRPSPSPPFPFLGRREKEPVPGFRGDTLGPKDPPIQVGQFMSTAPVEDSVNLEVTDSGDLLLRRGDLPGYPEGDDDEPLWAHRATGSIGGEANGGLLCAAEAWWQRWVKGNPDGIPVRLSVKNGRWRVGRGRFCTLGQSPKPVGSWRRNIPWDKRGRAIKGASLQLRESSAAVVLSGDEGVAWSSETPPRPRPRYSDDCVLPMMTGTLFPLYMADCDYSKLKRRKSGEPSHEESGD